MDCVVPIAKARSFAWMVLLEVDRGISVITVVQVQLFQRKQGRNGILIDDNRGNKDLY